MALFRRRVGGHLSEAARRVIDDARAYAVDGRISNPHWRALAREIARRDWRARLGALDFPYAMDDVRIGDVPCVVYSPGEGAPDAPAFVYLHAGAFVAGSARDNAAAALPLAFLSGRRGVGVDYSLAPERAFPAALDEIESVWRGLVARHPAASMILVGDSAGGNLALASLVRWRDRGLPLPAGAALFSAMLDGAAESDTMQTLRHHDPFINARAVARLSQVFEAYAPGRDLRDPLVSPLHADLRGLPPLLVIAGSRETLLGDAARLAEKARADGVDATLRVFDGMFHLFHMYWDLAEGRRAQEAAAAFLQSRVGPASAH